MQATKLETCEITSDILRHFVKDRKLRIRGVIEFDGICLMEVVFRMTSEGDKQLNFQMKSKKCENLSTTFESKCNSTISASDKIKIRSPMRLKNNFATYSRLSSYAVYQVRNHAHYLLQGKH